MERGAGGRDYSGEVIREPGTFPRWFSELNEAGERVTRERVTGIVDKLLKHEPLGTAEARIADALMAEARGRRIENAEQMLAYRRRREDERIAELDRLNGDDAPFFIAEDRQAAAEIEARAAPTLRQPAEQAAETDLARLEQEIEQLAEAYDRVRAEPLGPADDPLVELRSSDIERVLVERGPVLERGGEIRLPKRGSYGLVKFLIRHGELSKKEPERRVTRADILAFPEILRRFEPVETIEDATSFNRTWRIERDGREVVYGVSRFTATDQADHLVTVYVAGPDDRNFGRLSPERPGPRSAGLRRRSDAAAGAFDRPPQDRATPAEENVGQAGAGGKGEAQRAADLVVARRLPDGTVLYGRSGDLHPALIREGESPLAVNEQMGFARPGGPFMTRKEALEFVKRTDPERAAGSPDFYGLEGGAFFKETLDDEAASVAEADALVRQAEADADLFETAAACLTGALTL